MHRIVYRLVPLSLLLSALLSAQEFRATLNGRVMDASGAAVPGVVIQARNVDTNETASATSDAGGTYTIPFLRPGNYNITAEKTGFKKINREGVELQVAQTLGINLTLEVGSLTESVNVTAETPLLETEKADRGGVVDTQRVTELPLNARNPYILGSMMSGVTFRGAAIWQRPFDNGAIAEWSINGSRQSSNEFLLDGAPNNAQAGSNNVAYVPIVDAVQEFRVQSNTYDAQYGHTGGGVMNVILKSGTNQFHATGWEFLRRTPLDANTFQNNAKGQARAEHYLDQYGFQLEGPIVIPKLYNGKNKSFFLGSFENYREGTPTPLLISVPQPEFLQGDFSKLTDAQGRKITIYDPLTSNFDANNNPIRSPFPNNIIPANRINPIAQKILGYFPKPNFTQPNQRYGSNNFSVPSYFAQDKFYNLILKFDQNFGDKHRVFFRHASNDRTEDRNDNGVFKGPGQGGQQPFQRINDAYVIDWVSTITPTLVANVRASYNRFIEKGFGADNLGFDLTTLGFPAATVSQLPAGQFFGRYEFDGYSYLGRYRSVNITNNYALNANVNKIFRGHSLHAGVDIRRIHYIQQDTGDVWRFKANKNFTQQTWNQGDPLSGDGIASFLLGVPDEGAVNYPLFPFFRQWYIAPFFQDDWKVNSRLTLNFGLRWDLNFAPSEKYNRINSVFDMNAPSPIAAQIDKTQFPQFANLKGGLTFAGVGGRPTTVAYLDKNNFQPRIGVAYKLTDKIVLRTGFGTYNINPNNDYLNTSGFRTNTPLVSSLDGGRTPVNNLLSNPYPNGIIAPAGAAGGLNTFAGQNNWNFFDPNFRTPWVNQFSLGFQFQLPGNSVLDLSYVGSRTYDVQTDRNINVPSLAFRKQCNILEGGNPAFCNEQLPNPFKGIEAFRGTSYFTANTIRRYDLNRPFPQFGDINQRGRNDGRLWYNSLQANYQVRFRGGLNFLGNYTWSKQMERCCFNDAIAGVQQQSLYFLDRPHVLKLTTVYDLPFGQGKRFGNGANGFVKKLISGWEATTFLTAQSGEPIDWQNNSGPNFRILKDPKVDPKWDSYQSYGVRPCVARLNDNGQITFQQYSLDKGCGTDLSTYNFMILPSFAPRETSYRSGQIRMANTYTMDASLNKTTMIGDRVRVQFRAEAFNVLNHYAFPRARLNMNANDANFGSLFPANVSTVDSGFPRQIQLGFKIYW